MTGAEGAAPRVGVLLDDLTPPAWAAWLLREVVDHPRLELALVVVCRARAARRQPALLRLYETAERRLSRVRPDAMRATDVRSLVDGVPLIEGDIARAREHSLDVLLALGDARPREASGSLARHGVWAVRHGESDDRGAPLFWELSRAEPAFTTALASVADRPASDRILDRSSAATDPVSLARTRSRSGWKGARLALRRLEALADGRLQDAVSEAPPAVRPPPTNAHAAAHLMRIAGRVGGRQVRRRSSRRQWFLGLRPRAAGTLPHDNAAPWTPVFPPEDRYWADPFVLERDGTTHLLFEEVQFSSNRGELLAGVIEPGGRLTEIEPVMAAGHHLSYPYVFEDAGRTFLVPESGAARRVELWTADAFPGRWERVATLLEGVQAVDATICRHGELYWMWVNQGSPGTSKDDETFLYFSDRLDGGWQPHPLNPVVSDARHSRPAGRPFLHRGELLRPAQDCTGRYGARVVFKAITDLTPETYAEHPAGVLDATWAGRWNHCAHTYTFDGGWEATDGLRLVPRRRIRRG